MLMQSSQVDTRRLYRIYVYTLTPVCIDTAVIYIYTNFIYSLLLYKIITMTVFPPIGNTGSNKCL